MTWMDVSCHQLIWSFCESTLSGIAGAVADVVDVHDRVVQRLIEALAGCLRQLELGERVPERVDEGLVELHARLGHRVDGLAGDADLVVRLAHLEVLEGLREGGLRARVVRLGQELDEVRARQVIEAAARVLLCQRVDDRVEERLHLGRRLVVAGARHVVFVELLQALDRVGALRRIVEPLHPGGRVVLVVAGDQGRGDRGDRRGRRGGRDERRNERRSRGQQTKRAAERTHGLHEKFSLVGSCRAARRHFFERCRSDETRGSRLCEGFARIRRWRRYRGAGASVKHASLATSS
jgi:hypothetical protein